MNRDLALVYVFFVLNLASRESNASFSGRIWNLHLRYALSKDSPQSIAPTPAPAPGPSSVSPTPAIPPFPISTYGSSMKKCNPSYNTCHDLENMTACLLFAEKATVEQYLLIQNAGGTSLKVNVIISDAKFKEIQVPEHQSRKVNISDVLENSKIVLDAGSGKCEILLGSPMKSGSTFEQISSYVTHLHLVSGSYILLSIVLIIGGVWACCKIGTKERRADGVPYQELELAEQDSSPSNDLEASEGWDQGWDDDWDEPKPANKSNSQTKASGSSNGISSRTSGK
ncbi:uncharacterized protein LOC111486999 [Cucurbita maxima]|uniref:Uncharacterized protein LOC111486999 n=1 Tax=Cucurbita maxima TaxID=3661 RepID=A0A6J1JRW3_CUCMA|nr:uncharacterized protein LOC111486999 [Cucurbita maxima]